MKRTGGKPELKVASGLGLQLVLLAALAFAPGCLSGGGVSPFINPDVASPPPAPPPAESKAWQPAFFADEPLLTYVSNITEPGLNRYFPMSLFADLAGSFWLVWSHITADLTINLYGSSQTALSGSQWGSSEQLAFPIDAVSGVAQTYSMRPRAVVSPNGEVTVVYSTWDGSHYVPMAVRRTPVGWASASYLGPSPVADVIDSIAAATDRFNNVMVVWAQDGNALFNVYRPYLGWRFGPSELQPWHDGAGGGPVDATGMDFGFDEAGNGFGLYVDSVNQQVVAARWQWDELNSFTGHTIVSTEGSPTSPRLFFPTAGELTAFYYHGGGPWALTAKCADSSDAPTWGECAGLKLDDGVFDANGEVVDVYVRDAADPLPPIVKSAGNVGVLAFISNQSPRTAHVYRYDSGGWSRVDSIVPDEGDINWLDASINSRGDIAVAYSADVSGVEQVYAAVYSGESSFESERLDTNPEAPVFPEPARPSVTIDESSNVIVSFSTLDENEDRRAALAIFR